MAFMLLFGRRFVAYLALVIALGAVTAAVVALLTAQPVAALTDVPINPFMSQTSETVAQQPVELASTGTDDLTLSFLGAALVIGGMFMLMTANKVEQRKQ